MNLLPWQEAYVYWLEEVFGMPTPPVYDSPVAQAFLAGWQAAAESIAKTKGGPNVRTDPHS